MATVARGLGTEGGMRAGVKDPIGSHSEEGGGNGAVWRVGMGRAGAAAWAQGGRAYLGARCKRWGEGVGVREGRDAE